jgi:DNA topoisomerase-1
MVELIITEKPQAAKKIAEALCEGKELKENMNGVPYYKISRGKKSILVACAVGHLYGLDEVERNKKWKYPVFEIGWQPSFETKKESNYTKIFDDYKEAGKRSK